MKQVIYAFTIHPKFKDNGYIYVTWIPNPGQGRLAEGLARLALHGQGRTAGDRSRLGEGHLRMAQRRPQRRLPQVRSRRLSLHRHRRRLAASPTSSTSARTSAASTPSCCASTWIIPPPGKAYGIPKDNPFVNAKGARPEICAYGLRQLWRFSFDRKTGDLWGGEVGQDLWEMVYKIQKGGNYGWSRPGGHAPFPPGTQERADADPQAGRRTFAHRFSLDHRRLRLPRQALEGAGRQLHLRRFRHRPHLGIPTPIREATSRSRISEELARTTYRIVSFGEDAAGEIYFLDFTGGGIHQLVKAPSRPSRKRRFRAS